MGVQEKDEIVAPRASEFCIVRRLRQHRVLPQGHIKLILFGPAGIAHIGNVRAEITKDEYDWLE